MPQGRWPDEALADLAGRRDALRQAVDLPGADPGVLVGAALTELDGAIEALAAAAPTDGAGPDEQPSDGLPEAVRAERRLLHAAFQRTPVALFLLEQSGTIRRANDRAAALLGFPSGYATGKPLTAFVDLPYRAAVQTQLAAVARTSVDRMADCRILTSDGSLAATLTVTALELPGSWLRPRPRPAATPAPATVPPLPRRGPRPSEQPAEGERTGGPRLRPMSPHQSTRPSPPWSNGSTW
jgi:PAS domain S-box-containing protein